MNDGHELGNHTTVNSASIKMTIEQLENSINETENVLIQAGWNAPLLSSSSSVTIIK